MEEDPFRLDRFVNAQDKVYDRVVAELSAGRKTSHWMWFIFPQVLGLGLSHMSQHYAIRSAQEATSFLQHETLGKRLRQCFELLLQEKENEKKKSASQIMGDIDAVKLQSSATLFGRVALSEEDRNLCKKILERFYEGKEDIKTVNILSDWKMAEEREENSKKCLFV